MRSGTDSAAAALVQVLPRLMRYLHHGLRDYPLNVPQLRVLGALVDGERSAGDVAAELGIRPPTLTGLVEPLYRQGLVNRRRDPVAWRVVLLGLTPAGRDVYGAVLVAARKRLGGLVATLRPADQVALTHALLALDTELRQAPARSARPGMQRPLARGRGARIAANSPPYG